jgi:heme exporter protein D
MMSFDNFLETFVTGDYFLVFLAIMVMILIVLIVALIKTRTDYIELLDEKEKEETEEIEFNKDDLFSDLMATSKEEVIDEDKPLIKQIDVSSIKTFDQEINEYEYNEEENAIISSEELSKKTQERIDELGATSNQAVIDKYEEEQENKAIISYEQLLKNASNISLSYKEEKTDANAPKVNKVEVHSKEVSAPDNYLAEEECLKILKEFRINLE